MRGFLTFALIACWPVTLYAGENWPQFRGPAGEGHSNATDLPLKWGETEHIRWKVPIAGRGWSSPVVLDGLVWLTTAVEEEGSLRAIAVDARTGALRQNVEVFRKKPLGQINTKNSHASPTAVLEPGRVYVHFGAHGTACLSTDGQILWKNEELKYDHRHGPGGSPIVWQDLLIVSCDGKDVQFMAALDKNTGQIRWRKPRTHQATTPPEVPQAYSTPLVIGVDGKPQVVSPAASHILAVDPATGEELWWAAYKGYSNVPRPVYGHGMVFVSSGYDNPVLYAVRVNGHGNVTDTHVAWTLKRGAPLNPSMLLIGDELNVVSDAGIVSSIDAKSGKVHYQKRIGGNFSASPLFAEGRIYLTDEAGTTTVIAPGTRFSELASNKIDGQTLASLAAIDGAIFLRSDTHLYRIGN